MLITLLALQFSWSVVAGYCMHETGKAAQHLGHHPDTHPADDVATVLKDKPTDVKKSSVHAHCASCAHSSLSSTTIDVIAYPQIAEVAPVSCDIFLSSHYSAPPERPQWTSAA